MSGTQKSGTLRLGKRSVKRPWLWREATRGRRRIRPPKIMTRLLTVLAQAVASGVNHIGRHPPTF